MTRVSLLHLGMSGLAILSGCSPEPAAPPAVELRRFSLDSLDGVLTQSGVALDARTRSEGTASLRITADEPTTVRLFELPDVDVENARLVYRARIRTEGLAGKAYLEMWCRFAGRGEFFSRALETPLSGSVDWSSRETPFFLQTGEDPDLVKLNLVIEGTGTVWIDDVRLLRGPLD